MEETLSVVKLLPAELRLLSKVWNRESNTYFEHLLKLRTQQGFLKKEALFKYLGDREITIGLIETKYKNVTKTICELIDCQNKLKTDGQVADLLSVVTELNVFLDYTKQEMDIRPLHLTAKKLGRLCRFFNQFDHPVATVSVHYIQNSLPKNYS